MNAPQPWPGARWWKFDFHAHTPASYDYGKGPNQATLKNRSPKEWLLDYMRAEVDCVAVTDHNTGEWIDSLRDEFSRMKSEKPDGFRPIFLFPGVELSVHGGFHLLALFDHEVKTADINRLLGAVGFDPSKGGDRVTGKGAVEVIKEIIDKGGLAIPAHVDDHAGLFVELEGPTLEQTISSEHLFSMEMRDPESKVPQLYLDKKLAWTKVLGSDAHHPFGERCPGSHFTWVKMGSPTLEGVRLALLDGSMSTIRSDQSKDNPNDAHGGLYIESLTVMNARYMGRSSPFKCSFNPWMNAIIGGRGTGKSTLVEFLRMALRREGEWPDSLKKDFEKYGKIYLTRQDDGLLTKDVKLVVVYHKDGIRYRVVWTPNGSEQNLAVMSNDGMWQPSPGVITELLPVQIFSQKQIFEFARTPGKLLDIIDNALGDERRDWETKRRETETAYLSLRAKEREMAIGLKDEERLKGELSDVNRRLLAFEQAEHAEILKAYQHRKQQHRSLENWEKSWSGMGSQLRAMAEEITPPSIDDGIFDPKNSADLGVVDETSRIIRRLEKITRLVEKLADHADFCLSHWRSESSVAPWKHVFHDAEEKYTALRNKLREENAGEPNEFGALLQRRHALEQRLSDMASQQIQRDDVIRLAKEKLKYLATLRTHITHLRSQFLKEVLRENAYVRITPVLFGDLDRYESQLRELIQCDPGIFDREIGVVGTDGSGLLGLIQRDNLENSVITLKKVIRDLVEKGTCDNYAVRDSRFLSKIRKLQPDHLDRLDIWFPEDKLDVLYCSTGGGQKFESIDKGSPGQKTAAILAFLLSHGKEPLILDQPEDDLDNHLISELIVEQLNIIKKNRQVIVVTHNANIVVNGDAELIMALDVSNGQTSQRCTGNLQEQKVRQEICRIMEGGEKAFERRYRRIAHGGRHV
ncbi:MAG: ABC transporter [Magnetococcales bacterium]|nr:ABC transporter [Magnetococcales bacterium]